MSISDDIIKYTSGDVYPMHMPGHKRNTGFLQGLPAAIDITEIDGFDDLHQSQGVLRETSSLASKLYGSETAYLLINGATAGVLAAVGGFTRRGDKVLMARNCHLSVYNAIALFGLQPVYIMPDTESASGIALSIKLEAVETALRKEGNIRLVIVTSPTYEGVASDVAAIAAIAHQHGVPLFVDSAHGAHFGFSTGFPASAACATAAAAAAGAGRADAVATANTATTAVPTAVGTEAVAAAAAAAAGADAVVMSLHKTLPALTQCSLLHVNAGGAAADEIGRLLSVFQTSSPSYVLMASIDSCLRTLESESAALFSEYEKKLSAFYSETAKMENLRLQWNPANEPAAGVFAFDHGKLVIRTEKTALTGNALMRALREKYNIELEMACGNYALAMTSICDTPEGFRRLADALIAIDREQTAASGALPVSSIPPQTPAVPRRSALPSDALQLKGRFVPLEESAELMSLEYVWAYPPGIPVIVPGEIIDSGMVSYIIDMHSGGISLKSTKGRLPEYVYVAERGANA